MVIFPFSLKSDAITFISILLIYKLLFSFSRNWKNFLLKGYIKKL